MRSYPVVLNAERMALWPRTCGAHQGASSWSGELILEGNEWHHPRLGSGLEHGAAGGLSSVLRTLLVGGIEQCPVPPALLNVLLFPSAAAGPSDLF